MAITKIAQDLRFAECGVSVNNDGSYDGAGKEIYVVTFDNADSPASRPYIARDYTQEVGGVRIPAMWESHPYSPWIYVKNKRVSMWNGPFHWQVTVEYEYVENPLTQPYTAEWLFSTSNEPVDRDREDNALVNSADEPWDPAITEEASDLVLRITRNEASYDPAVAAEFKRSVNSATFLWFPPKTVKCSVFEGVRTRVANLWYAKVNYEFVIRLEKDKLDNYIGWKRRILDQGLRTKDAQGNYTLIRDSEGDPITTPVKLNGLGQKLTSGADPVFLIYETKRLTDYSPLGFATTDAPFYYGAIS
jgi:hypothetical protein